MQHVGETTTVAYPSLSKASQRPTEATMQSNQHPDAGDGDENQYQRQNLLSDNHRGLPANDHVTGDAHGRGGLAPPGMVSADATSYWAPSDAGHPTERITRSESPIDLGALQMAMPFGVDPFSHDDHDTISHDGSTYNSVPHFIDETPNIDITESDTAPLTASIQPISGATATQETRDFRSSHSMDFLGPNIEAGQSRMDGTRGRSFGASLEPEGHRISRSPSPSGAISRAGSMVRAMSQRVVNISGEGDPIRQRRGSHVSSRPSHEISERHSDRSVSPVGPMFVDTSYQPHLQPDGSEKLSPVRSGGSGIPINPLKGKTLGIFSPDNPIRIILCNILVNPYTEPAILLLIVLQVALLAAEAAPDVFSPGHNRPDRWSGRVIDWIMLALFVVFTLEIVARVIVSGFAVNAAEYSTIDRRKGVRSVVADQYKSFFQPHRQKSVRGASYVMAQPISRSFTNFMAGQENMPETAEDHRKYQLARRAFLRHSFNRFDFVSVVCFWLDFALSISGVENKYHLYLFKMLSCLRILRLLALTNGTAVILRSLKKAAPLLVRVAFLICFFWLLFAIIGVQSFKSSLARTCVWLDPQDPGNFTAAFTVEGQFCGGFLNNATGRVMPWVEFSAQDSLKNLINGSGVGKGYICPRGSICLQQDNPYNGTVNFDNIFHSLELVFVIMSANTFTDIMYDTMGSDYLQAALFFAAGIVIMMLWMTNLLIAVITSSFQVIREEGKASAFTAKSDDVPQTQPDERLIKKSALQKVADKISVVFVLIIVFGLVAQAFRSNRMPDSRERFINGAEIAVTILLDIEIVLRLIAYWRTFHKSWRNLFDLGLAIITTIILIPPIRGTRAYAWLTVFQIIRIYRVVLAVPITRKLILLVLGNASGVANLMLFVFLMTFLVSILACQLFRGIMPTHTDGNLNRISFFTLYNAFLGMYQILSSENWTDVLYNVTSHTHQYKTSWIGAGFLVGWFILSYFILVNMFIAVIQENFDVSEDEKRLEQVKAFLNRKELGHNSSNLALSTIFSFGKNRKKKDAFDFGSGRMEQLLNEAVVKEFLDEVQDGPANLQDDNISLRTAKHGNIVTKTWQKIAHRLKNKEPNPFYTDIRFDGPNDTLGPREIALKVQTATAARRRAQREYLARHPTYNDSLYIFKPKNKLRLWCQSLVGPARGQERPEGVEPNTFAWGVFSALIYAAVLAMVIIACVTTPLYQKEYKERHQFSVTNWYVWTDLAFTILFTVEAGIKIIADGLLWTPNAYLRSSWGLLDGVVLITLWINAVTLLVNDGAISRAIGAFKALRALRLLSFSRTASRTFHSLILVGWWKVLGAAFVSLSLLIPFAIYGLNLFNGLLIICNDGGNINTLDQCFGEFSNTPFSNNWPMLMPRVAANQYFKFDDFGSSLFILFQIVSQEGWMDVSFAVQAITGHGMQPQDLASQGNAVFFVVFNLMATVFILTLFISVFMRNYTEQTGVAFLTTEQRAWLELHKLLRHVAPSKASYNDKKNRWQRWCHKRAIEKRGKWYVFITIVLVLHLALLVVEFRGEPQWWTWTRDALFVVFIIIYIVNIIIRIVGLSWARFRKSAWDMYSLVAVAGAFATSIALLIAGVTRDTYVQLHKFFLVAVVLMLIPRNDALDQLFKTAAASLPIIGNLLITWVVMFLVFAIALTQAFSLTRFGGSETNNLNLRTVPKALILLFRMSLGEGWNQIMEDFADIEPPLCVESGNFFNSDCGSKPWARILFVAWNIISMYIFVNLFVSLIYESFSYVYQRSSGVDSVDRDEIRRFKEAWRSVDPQGTGFITKEAFPRLLGELSGVFSMRIYEPEDSVGSILEDVRSDDRMSHHAHVISPRVNEIDLAKLNRRIANIDVQQVRARRRRFNIFYEEVMVMADHEQGIRFTDVLVTLASYNIVNDSKSYKLEEFLRRRARLQKVDDEIQRRTVQGFFEMVRLSRIFRKHMAKKHAGRMTAIPQLNLPEIFVDDGDDNSDVPKTPVDAPGSPDAMLSAGAGPSNTSAWPTTSAAGRSHPLSLPRIVTHGLSPPGTPSALSFDIARSEHSQGSGERSRRGSSGGGVSPAQAREMLDDSVWVQSIRKSKTTRKADRTSYRYGDLG